MVPNSTRKLIRVGIGSRPIASHAWPNAARRSTERGPRTNEYLRLWQACWAPGKVSFAGRFFSFSNMHVSPKPVQQPHPPIWIGGASDGALRRAARFAALWQPTPLPVGELVERQTALRQACEQIGRVPIPTRMSFSVEISAITGNAPPSGSERPVGHVRRPKWPAIY